MVERSDTVESEEMPRVLAAEREEEEEAFKTQAGKVELEQIMAELGDSAQLTVEQTLELEVEREIQVVPPESQDLQDRRELEAWSFYL
jgi:hypothetical protein